MKKTMFFIAILFALTGYAQNTAVPRNGLYKWTTVVLMMPCLHNGSKETADSAKVLSLVGQKFRVLYVSNDNKAVIQILDYTKKTKCSAKTTQTKVYDATPNFFKYNYKGKPDGYTNLEATDVNSRNYGSNQRYFLVDVSYIDAFAVKETKVGLALTTGVINFPFKYRPQKNKADFSGAFNFGAAIGFTLPHKQWRKFTHSVISGYSISEIVLDSASTDKNQKQLSSTNNFSAFSFSLGYLVQYQSVQAGIFVGVDRLSRINQEHYGWHYQGKPWISIGFGLAIFSKETAVAVKKDPTN